MTVDLSLGGLAPAQSPMDLFLDTPCARNKQRADNFNQSGEAMSRVTASAMFFQGHDFRGNGCSKNKQLICDCAGQPTHAITTLLSNSHLVSDRCRNFIPFHTCCLSVGQR